MALLARAVLAIIVGVIIWLACGLIGQLLVENIKAGFGITFGNWLLANANLLGFLAGLAYFFLGFVNTSRFFRPVP